MRDASRPPLPSPWWTPHVHHDRKVALHGRARILRAIRGFFEERGFIEVETGILQASPGNETHLHALSSTVEGPDGGRRPFYLHTSPEFACKKLIAAGETRIFTLARVFRDKERGALHHPEFTMLEWYRANEDYETLMKDCAALLAVAAEAVGGKVLRWRGREADPFAMPQRLSVAEAFARFAGIDLMAALEGPARSARDRLASAARQAGMRVAEDDDLGDIFSRIVTEKIEPHLGIGAPTILFDYPISQAALARPKPSDPRVAERFELYACGVELANAFGELIDAAEQRRRFEADMAEKERRYGTRYPLDEDLLAALGLMPPTSGIALGLDRLVMLATGVTRIEDVLWTPLP
ncbi:lysyl-tRNA synthetase, class 2 [Rhizobiales bacterium GAS191]|nr:lysyl-tRNA synthetase, class 2 [Rhizobiales bacterium GAS191]